MFRRPTLVDIVSWLLLLGLAVTVWYFWDQVNYSLRTVTGQVAPCATPVRYRFGEFDSRFGISQQQFMKVVDESAAAWADPVDRPVFEYHPQGELAINLIYDYRQEATDRLAGMGISMDQERNQYDQLKQEYEARKATIARQQTAYDRNDVDYETKVRAFESEVDRWNAQGGAPPPVYARLNEDKTALDAQLVGLQGQADALNQAVDELNAVVTVLNGIGARLNRQVDDYNQTARSRGEKFQEGEYVRDAAGTRINIYEFRDEMMLRRVMMHELGHALGLDHVGDPQAIMYELNTAPEAALAASDRQLVQERCAFEWPWASVVE